MSYVVGFDLGTHQTKICIQDSTNPAEKTYRFLEFERHDGTQTVLFPSIVQINTDHTLSYGFVDKSRCMTESRADASKPILVLEDYPAPFVEPKFQSKAKYPPKPKLTWKEQ